MKKSLLSAAVAASLLLSASTAFAITNNEANITLPFTFSPPGARSLGMGGAFIGAADDATAAYSNPAGLTRIGLEQQFSLEFRHIDGDAVYPAAGSFLPDPFDTSGIDYDAADFDSDDVSFIGWVYPAETWSLALYRHQTLNYRNNYSSDLIFFEPANETFIRPFDANVDLELVTWGASFAMNLTDNLSWGAGVNWQDFDIESSVFRFEGDGVTPANLQTQDGSDTDFGYSLGLLYKGSDGFSIGLSYRSETEFDYRFQNLVFDPFDDGQDVLFANGTTNFKTPDVFGIGVSWRATDSITINADINRVGYSNLTDQVVDNFFAGGDFAEFTDPELLNAISIDNAVEPRLGIEYLIATLANPVSLRAGVWHEKAHGLKFDADPNSLNFDDPVSAAAFAVLFPRQEDDIHYSVGFGWAFPSFQIDFAYDTSDRIDIYSFSGVYRF